MIRDITPEGLWYVMTHLRAKDHREAHCTLIVDDNVARACNQLYNAPGHGWEVCRADGTPTVVGGFAPIWPGLCAGWMYGTAYWQEVALEVTHFVKHASLPGLEHAGFHRIECRAQAGNDDVIRWLKLLGFKQEAVTAQFGQGREDFLLFARTTPRGSTSSS